MATGAFAWESALSRPEAGVRLGDFVRDLTRARRLQIFVELAGGGLFFGLLAACVSILATRLFELPFPVWPAAGAALALGLVAAAGLAWRRRPDTLQVSILADIEIGLEQRLSTAWEFALRHPGTALTARLAAQALARRVPMTNIVFPLRISVWGRLAPLAALLLALVALVDPGWRIQDPVAPVDPLVAEEGVRLREHGQRMEEQARRESLPRSREAASGLQRLGARMESGSSSREQALSRLRELDAALGGERRAVLAQSLPAAAADLPPGTLAGAPLFSDGRLGALLSSVQQGTLTPGDLEMLGNESTWISALWIAPEELEQALARYASGEHEALAQLLETLSEMDGAIREAQLLWDAEQVVRLARENLGDAGALLGFPGERGDAADRGDGALALLNARVPVRADEDAGPFSAALKAPGRGMGVQTPSIPSVSPRSRRTPDEVALEIKGRPGEGDVYRTEARVLPRAGQVSIPAALLSPEFHGELEAVLAKQSYPLHQRELVRQYFLRLSQGTSEGRTAKDAP